MSMSVHVIPTTKLTIYFRQCLAIDTSALGSHSTDLQRAKVLERSNALRRKFEAWTEVQQFYIPSVTMFHARTEMSNVPQAVQELDLYLPSLIADGDESLTSLAVYFRNWHMFSEYMNNIPC